MLKKKRILLRRGEGGLRRIDSSTVWVAVPETRVTRGLFYPKRLVMFLGNPN